ncbi:MAG: B12-binding domain-containing radical SAM protein, partial [Christensenellaceae bacterium]
MKTLLIAINSSYVHTNLAVRSILAASKNPMELREYNINQQLSDVVSDLLDAEIAAFSCYIWN